MAYDTCCLKIHEDKIRLTQANMKYWALNGYYYYRTIKTPRKIADELDQISWKTKIRLENFLTTESISSDKCAIYLPIASYLFSNNLIIILSKL